MKVWIVESDDRNYDYGDTWIVGVFSSLELAEQASEKDLQTYIKQYECTEVQYNIEECEIDVPCT